MDRKNVIANIFRRGQVWHWEDPTYHEKSSRNTGTIPPGDAVTHFSRYVLIVQDPSTCPRDTIVCVPISSSNHLIHDVAINIDRLSSSNIAYAKCQNIFPVRPQMLTSYICTVSDESMKIIAGEIARMFIPDLIKNYDAGDLYRTANIITVNDTVSMIESKSERDMLTSVANFVSEIVVFTIGDRTPLAFTEIKKAYDQWCIWRGYPRNYDVMDLVEAFIGTINTKLFRSGVRYEYPTKEQVPSATFTGMKLRNNIPEVYEGVSRPRFTDKPNSAPFGELPEEKSPDQEFADIIMWVLQYPTVSAPMIEKQFHMGSTKSENIINRLWQWKVITQGRGRKLRVVLPSNLEDLPEKTLQLLERYQYSAEQVSETISKRFNLNNRGNTTWDVSVDKDGKIQDGPKEEPPKKKKGRRKKLTGLTTWTPDNKLNFMLKFEEDGPESAAAEYDLAIKTAKSYYRKFRAEVDPNDEAGK